MPHEQPKSSQEQPVDIDAEVLTKACEYFSEDMLIHGDALNAWPHSFSGRIENDPTLWSMVKPVPHYTDCLRTRYNNEADKLQAEKYTDDAAFKHAQDILRRVPEAIIQLSDPVQIEAFDALARKFNDSLEEMKNNNDVSKLKDFVQRADKLVNTTAAFKQFAETYFGNGELLCSQSYDAWPHDQLAAIHADPTQLENLEQVWEYQAYFDDQRGAATWAFTNTNPKPDDLAVRQLKSKHKSEREALNDLSDPAQVAAFDALVGEYNAYLDRIKDEHDIEALKVFLRRAHDIVYQKKASA